MKIIKLKIINLNDKILEILERKKLIRILKAPKKVLKTKRNKCEIEKIYSSHPRFGSHKLIAIGLDKSCVELNYHSDNEEFMILKDPSYKCRPVHIVIGLEKYEILEKKAKEGTISEKDVLVIRWPHNHPVASVFTMLKGTAHCELVLPGKEPPPYYFVSEPSKLDFHYMKLYKNDFTVLP